MPHRREEMRDRVAAFLPLALKTAIQSYKTFSDQPESTETPTLAADFKKHHDALKVAIAHIELLVKLAKIAGLPEPEQDTETSDEDLRKMIETAETELDKYKGS